MKPPRAALLLPLLALVGCQGAAPRRGATIMFASGADLQSINPLLTVHPLARQVQRYLLFTTLVRYDSTLAIQPYLARTWAWSEQGKVLTLHIFQGLRWHDGVPTTARDAAWTLNTARDPETGYPRLTDLASLSTAEAPDDSTLVLRFTDPQAVIPDVLTDLAILPAHLLDTVLAGGLRGAAFNAHPVGNGPFRFVTHEANRRWVFRADSSFPAALGGPPRLERFVVAVVDEPTTKLAALASGELDFAGIQPAHAEFVRRDPDLAVLTYPLLFTYGIVFNTRKPPFDDPAVRHAVSLALDRRQIVDGYIYGFGTAAFGPVVPGLPGYVPATETAVAVDSARALLGGRSIAFELLTVGSGEAALEQMIQAQLARAGFKVRIRQMELTAFLDRVNSRHPEFAAAVLGTAGDLGLGYLTPLGALAGVEVPPDRAQAQRMFEQLVPVAFLYHARGVQGMNRRVENVTMDLRGELSGVSRWSVHE
ncbi:MAG: ABC transporter substrate-binding protein [Gemmatimonadota bacterium]